ncbi:MAG: hypothetical protein MUF57_10940 [Gammaproteobacteria bacterium]|nr:hypothetical protein [Gammaproteobacteria bacterium]
MRARSWLWIALSLPAIAHADGLPYRLTIPSSGDAALDRAIEDASQLARLKDRAPVGPFALVARAEARIDSVLRSFGYYDAVIVVRIAGLPSGDARLLPKLERLGGDPPVPVEVEIDPGPVYRIGSARLDGPVPDGARQAFGLADSRPWPVTCWPPDRRSSPPCGKTGLRWRGFRRPTPWWITGRAR